MADRSSVATSDILLVLLRRLLRPLVRLMLQSGITYPVFAAMLSALFVDVASRDLLDAASRTDSRISLMTGIHRKELRRLRTEASPEAAPTAAVTLGAALVTRWLSAAPWMDEEGHPRPLPRTARNGEPSFEALVATATKDVRPRTVLEEWLSHGIVSLDPADRVVLNEAAFLPRPERDERLFDFARNLHDHLAAAVGNVTALGQAPFVDRSVHYDRLSPEAAARLQDLAANLGQRLLMEVHYEAARLLEAAPKPVDAEAAGAAPSRPTRRVNLGVYLYTEDETGGVAG